MEILPEEPPGGDDCSSLSSNGGPPKESATSKTKSKTAHPPGSTGMVFWRNSVFACLIITALTLAVAAYLCFSIWDNSKALPGVSVVVILVCFCNLMILFYKYDEQVQQQSRDLSILDFQNTTTDKPTPQCIMSDNNNNNNNPSENGSDFMTLKNVTNLLVTPFQYAATPFQYALNAATSARPPPTSTGQRRTLRASHMSRSSVSHDSDMSLFLGAVRRDHTFLSDDAVGMVHQTQPVAEFFAETTVLYADIAGFTAWSSVREPSQVFALLETLFHAFDGIAQTRKVFKVETVGDCYVAVTGLPQPDPNHAVTMAYFARDCLTKMDILCEKLETSLGPDTSDLRLRLGIHSGAVTGGVLRGKRSRFQLFGDTVNTAALMESTGEGGKIHLSETTAELIKGANKSNWLLQRESHIAAKGKGVLQTYYLNTDSVDDPLDSNTVDYEARRNARASVVSLGTGVFTASEATSKALGNKLSSAKLERLISWNVDLLLRLLKQSVARRQILLRNDPRREKDADESIYMNRDHSLLDEVQETIRMPSDFRGKEAIEQAKTIQLDPAVREQLHEYVRIIANMYQNNPFHNFEHASHVTMSVAKLLSRIVAPSANEFKASTRVGGTTLDDHTYGITSDPLTQFACILSALIHDADHPGVPNTQLVKEETEEAKRYQGKSVAEQNSLDKAWDLLMQPKYQKLRETIYTTSAGLARFRSLLINSVLATDIVDKDLKSLRNARWDKAFKTNGSSDKLESDKDSRDRKATIVIEHLIQASDVAHTMQHWHVYRQWNEKLFRELYKAWKEGRAEKNPAEFWYKGEIGFFDFYIIPLAKKLKECGVFGVSSSEYLDYAMNNRAEWEDKGEQAVQEMLANIENIEAKALKKQAEAQEAWLTNTYGDDDDESIGGSSGVISFDSRASWGAMGQKKK